MRLILSVLIPLFLLASCEKEKENIQLPLNDLSGEYTLVYVGSQSDGRDSNLTRYCGGKYELCVASQVLPGQYSPYGLVSCSAKADSLLLDFQYQRPIVLDEEGLDTVLCYRGSRRVQYDPACHALADSLLVGIGNTVNWTLFAHKDHLLLQTDRGPRGDYRYFRFEPSGRRRKRPFLRTAFPVRLAGNDF